MDDVSRRFCDRFGLLLPVIQAPMAGVQGSALAIEVSAAGALGSLPCALLDPAGIRRELSAITAATSKPYNVNFFSHAAPVADREREAAWRGRLAPYYRELDIDPDATVSAPVRTPFDAAAAEVLGDFRPPVVSFHFGLPSAELLATVKSWGATVMSSATTVDEALWLEAHGADVIVAQGLEAGGHRGMFLSGELTEQMGTFALVPQIACAVRVPVVAAGGIADAAGVAAALRLGAAAVQIGTSYLLCHEATTSKVHRAALKSDAARHTAVTNVFTGRLARSIRNRIIAEVGPVAPDAPAFPIATNAILPLRAKAESLGIGDFSTLWAGQNVTGCREVGAAELTRDLAASL